jgi:Na+-driven multidrug efflux pump
VEAYAIGKRFLIITPLLGVVVGAILVLIRNPALNLMGIETAQARSVAESLLLFYSGWVGIRNISYTAVVGIFRAGGDTKMGFFLDCVIMFVVAVPIVAALGFFTDIPFVWLVVAMYLAEDAPKTFICLWYFRSKKWIRQLTQAGNNAERA